MIKKKQPKRAAGFLQKPFNDQALVDLINSAFGNKTKVYKKNLERLDAKK